nr:lipocalin family protein [Tabrizicola sp. YIM 78059]
MHRVIPALLAALMLAACVTSPQRVAGFRQADVPIWSAAAFAPDRIAGRWQQVAGYAVRPGGCASGELEVIPAAGGYALRGTLCLDGKTQPVAALARPVGPGRLAVEGQEVWWVLWVDSGYRTLAIGTPSGRFGFVLDQGAISPDRLSAAREIFEFNGYVPGGLRPF